MQPLNGRPVEARATVNSISLVNVFGRVRRAIRASSCAIGQWLCWLQT
jgi:hypothetical protein